jgi:hypothetical protein
MAYGWLIALGWIVVACSPAGLRRTEGEEGEDGAGSPSHADDDDGIGRISARVPHPECPQTDSGVVAAYGRTGLMLANATCENLGVECDNMQLTRNLLECLGSGRERDGRIAVLYASACDPRFDEDTCQYGDFSELAPFFELVEEIGYVDFAYPTRTPSLHDYSVVIADMCREAGPLTAEREAMLRYAHEGGRLLVLGDDFCDTSAELANLMLEELGTSFTAEDPAIEEPLFIPDDRQVGLLEGVQQLLIWRTTPQDDDTAFTVVVGADHGPLLTILELQGPPRSKG